MRGEIMKPREKAAMHMVGDCKRKKPFRSPHGLATLSQLRQRLRSAGSVSYPLLPRGCHSLHTSLPKSQLSPLALSGLLQAKTSCLLPSEHRPLLGTTV